MLLLVNLPDVILKHLQSFLSNDDIRYFLNSNKLYFSSLKQETIYFSLNPQKSQEYLRDERFREMILSKVKDKSKQIGLVFHRNYDLPDIRDIVAHKIVFSRFYPHLLDNVPSLEYILPNTVQEIPFLPILQDLTLSNCRNIQDFSNLSHLKRLKLSDATQLTDITPVQNIPHLTFTDCPNIQDFSPISSKRQNFISIYKSAITDVSFLRNLLQVKLYLCNQLVDVSPLHGVRELFLSTCSSIQDISGLGNHHRLTIFHCDSINRGFECFRTVRHAELFRLKVTDFTVFQEIRSLRVPVYSPMESQLSLLKDIPDLTLCSMLEGRKEVYDISDLRNIKLTLYDDIVSISDTNFPSQLLYLKLEKCNQIVKMINEGKTSIFHHLQSLHLTNCPIEHVNGLGDIPTIILEHCVELHDISGLGRNRCVELKICPNICEVSSLATVSIVTVRYCRRIVDISSLSSVPRLTIIQL